MLERDKISDAELTRRLNRSKLRAKEVKEEYPQIIQIGPGGKQSAPGSEPPDEVAKIIASLTWDDCNVE